MSVEAVRRTVWFRMITLLACAAALTTLVLARPLSAHSAPQRSQSSGSRAIRPADSPLPGANDWLCRPSPQRPEPVVLVHGIFATPAMDWPYTAQQLHDKGFCVFALTWGTENGKYPLPGMASIEDSAKELRAFVARVLTVSGARKVDLLGHSAGGLMPREYLRFEGGAPYVDDFVALGPPNHGTTFHSAFHELPAWVSNAICPSCLEYDAGSELIIRLNNDNGDEVVPGVSYTTISTKFDQYILPYTSAWLKGSSSQVTNVTVQDTCPDDTVDHVGLSFDPVVLQWAVNALDRPGPADPGFRPHC